MFKKNKQNSTTNRRRSEKLPPRSKNYSYYESRSSGDNKERASVDDRRQIERANPVKGRSGYLKIVNIIIILLVIAFVIDNLILSTNPGLIISGNTNTTELFSVSRVKYQDAAAQLFTQSISMRTKITIDTSHIALQLEKDFPELSNVSVSLPLIGHQPTVTVVPAVPAIIVTPQGQAGSFLVATDGRVLASSTSSWPKNTLPKVVDDTGINYIVGRTTMSTSDISFIQLVATQFAAKNITITSMTLPAQSRELDVYISGGPYYIQFNLEDNTDALQQIGTYFATRQYLINNKITPSQYIDAMVVGRVYYK
jgi:glycine cleavage system regulatory protein